jgi:hypothetical protein
MRVSSTYQHMATSAVFIHFSSPSIVRAQAEGKRISFDNALLAIQISEAMLH